MEKKGGVALLNDCRSPNIGVDWAGAHHLAQRVVLFAATSLALSRKEERLFHPMKGLHSTPLTRCGTSSILDPNDCCLFHCFHNRVVCKLRDRLGGTACSFCLLVSIHTTKRGDHGTAGQTKFELACLVAALLATTLAVGPSINNHVCNSSFLLFI